MAGEETIGRVSVDVVPDASNFSKEAEAQLRRQRVDPKDVSVIPVFDADIAKLNAQASALARSLARDVQFSVDVDFASIPAIADYIEEVAPRKGLQLELDFDPSSEASIRRTLDSIRRAFSEKLVLNVDKSNADEVVDALEDTLARIREQKIKLQAELDANSVGLTLAKAQMLRRLAEDHVKDINAGFKIDAAKFAAEVNRAIEIVEKIAKLEANVEVATDPEAVSATKAEIARLKGDLERLAIRVRVEPNVVQRSLNLVRLMLERIRASASVQAVLDMPSVALVRAMLDAQLQRFRPAANVTVKVATNLAEAARASVEAGLELLSRDRRVSIIPDLAKVSQAAVSATLGLLSRDRVVNFYVQMGKGLGQVASVLSGFDALTKGINEARRALTGMFTNLPQFAAATTAVFALAGALISSAANMTSLAGSAAQAIPILLTLPGIAIGIATMAAALKDFDSVLPDVAAQLKELQPIISGAFWDKARAGVQSLADAIIGPLRTGLTGTATVIGDFMGSLARGLGEAIGGTEGPLAQWFARLQASVVAFSPAITNLVSIFAQFGEVGSAMLVPLATYMADLAARFDAWFAGLVDSAGGVQSFAEQVVGAFKGLVETVIGFGAVFGAIFRAAEASGAITFEGLATKLKNFANTLNEVGNQEKMVNLFNAAQTMWDNFANLARDNVRSATENIVTLLQAALPVVGTIMGTMTSLLASAVTPEAVQGINEFVAGIAAAIEAMRPAFASLGPLIAQIGPVLGTLATQIGQVFGALTPSITGVIAALAPVIETLGSGLVTVIQAVQPAIQKFADALAQALANPALTQAINSIVNALVALAPALLPLVDLGARLVAVLLPVVAAVLEPLAGLIQQLVPLFPVLTAAIMGIISAIMPIIPMLVNLVVAVITPLLPLLVQLASAVLPVLVPVIQLLATVLQTVMLALQPIVEFVLPLFTTLLGGLVGVISLVVTAISGFVQGALQWIQDGITKISDGIAAFGDKWEEIWNNVFEFFTGLWTKLLNWIKDLLGIHSPSRWFMDLAENILQGMLDGLKAGWEWIVGFFTGAWDWLKSTATQAFENLKTTVLNAWDAIKGFFSDAWENLKTTVTNGWNSIKSFFTEGAAAIKEKATEAWNRVKSAFTEGIDTAVTTVKELPGKVKSALGNLGSTLWQAGRDLVQGLLNGIASLAGTIGSWFLNRIPSWIREPFKAALGIASPSKVFFEFGRNIIDGLIEGMQSRHRRVFQSLEGLASGMAETEFNLPNITGGIAAVAQMVAAATAGSGGTRILNYYAAPGSSIGSEEDLFAAMGRGRAWGF